MNENIDLTEILKDAPEGLELYSTIHGRVEFQGIDEGSKYYPIIVETSDNVESFTKDGRIFEAFDDTECILFPSRDQRDWSKFQVPNQVPNQKKKVKVTLHPFDKVLVRDMAEQTWKPALFWCIDEDKDIHYQYLIIFGGSWKYCIPYNSDTAHLLETTYECPIDYDIEFDKSYKE